MVNLKIEGVDCHIGSQLTETRPFIDALDRVLALIDQLSDMGINIHHLDLGGGLGIQYRDETPPLPAEYAKALSDKLAGRNLQILIEPGRAIAGNAGILVTQVEFLKNNGEKHFAIVDAAMNDLMRPALYSAWQDIIPVNRKDGRSECYDIVGPICETGDFLGKDRELILEAGDLLAVRSSGAYGFTMSSNYNTRPRVAEIMVDGDKVHVVRERETIESLYANEKILH
jgi:diaminopimelate decarboxylase